jgi:hypothetical protein
MVGMAVRAWIFLQAKTLVNVKSIGLTIDVPKLESSIHKKKDEFLAACFETSKRRKKRDNNST